MQCIFVVNCVAIGGLIMVDFGERLKQLRMQAGLTQQQLASKLNLTKSVVSYYELQERYPSPEVLMKLASIFHVTTDYLLGIENKHMIDVSELSDENLAAVITIVNSLKNKDKK